MSELRNWSEDKDDDRLRVAHKQVRNSWNQTRNNKPITHTHIHIQWQIFNQLMLVLSLGLVSSSPVQFSQVELSRMKSRREKREREQQKLTQPASLFAAS